MKVLVTCASPHGSTRGIAERIAQRLREHGSQVDCRPVDAVTTLAPYAAVVLGSAIHDQAWVPEASAFVVARAADLVARPVWLFSVGMPGALPRAVRQSAMREGPKVMGPVADLVRPRGTHLFSGVLSPQQFTRSGRLRLRLTGARYGDFRDWDEIDAWADEIAASLGPAVTGKPEPGNIGRSS